MAIFGLFIIMFLPLHALAQESTIKPIKVVKTSKDETFVIPYQAANRDNRNPYVYKYDQPKGLDWIFTIDDKLSYLPGNQSKVVITIKEAAPSTKFLQLFMYGDGAQKKFVVAVNVPDSGYQIIDTEQWVSQDFVTVTMSDNSGLSVANGQRIVVDRLDVQGLNPASIEVYGKDESTAPPNAYAGTLGMTILYGSPADSPVYYVPAAVMVGVGVLMGVLLYKKKRTP